MKINSVDIDAFQEKAKVFFHSQKWKRLWVFLVFVVLVSCFWVLQNLQQKTEREISVPIYYTQIPSGLVVSDSLPSTMTLKLLDKGSVFLKYYFNRKFAMIRLNLKNLPLDQSSYTIERYALSAQVQELLANTTQILSFQPERIQIHYSPLQKKKVPVLINGKITTAPGFMFRDSIHINPSHVWIYGKRAALDTVQYVQTEVVNKENVSQKLDMSLQLTAPDGICLDTDKIKLLADIEEYTEKIIELPVLCYNQPKDVLVRFFPASVGVISQLTLNQYSQLKESDLKVSVDYNDFSQNSGANIKVVLSQRPNWLIHYRIVPESVEYLIEQKGDLQSARALSSE
ncbi:MAG: YbbR-like domain-containing protein [Candidatus Azobacteroides sp.]|nr:YbbR-like domain-containing protein [Candidatus Azobacteroides sp.]